MNISPHKNGSVDQDDDGNHGNGRIVLTKIVILSITMTMPDNVMKVSNHGNGIDHERFGHIEHKGEENRNDDSETDDDDSRLKMTLRSQTAKETEGRNHERTNVESLYSDDSDEGVDDDRIGVLHTSQFSSDGNDSVINSDSHDDNREIDVERNSNNDREIDDERDNDEERE